MPHSTPEESSACSAESRSFLLGASQAQSNMMAIKTKRQRNILHVQPIETDAFLAIRAQLPKPPRTDNTLTTRLHANLYV